VLKIKLKVPSYLSKYCWSIVLYVLLNNTVHYIITATVVFSKPNNDVLIQWFYTYNRVINHFFFSFFFDPQHYYCCIFLFFNSFIIQWTILLPLPIKLCHIVHLYKCILFQLFIQILYAFYLFTKHTSH